jgi:hypothetical protein
LDRLVSELEEPVALLGADLLSASRLRVLLGRGELRAWRVSSDAPAGLLSVDCPLGAGPATLATARPLGATPLRGDFIVGHSLPVGPRRWILLGKPALVAGPQAGEFEALLRSLRAPRGEFWRVHGTVVAHAARAA